MTIFGTQFVSGSTYITYTSGHHHFEAACHIGTIDSNLLLIELYEQNRTFRDVIRDLPHG
jgi:hypothetical protein